MDVGALDFQHVVLLLMTLTLALGNKISRKQTCLLRAVYTFQLIRMKLVAVFNFVLF